MTERAAFEDDNLGVLVQTRNRRPPRPAGNASNDDELAFSRL